MITIFIGSGWSMFSENTLMLYQQDLQLFPYFVKLQLAIDRGSPRFPLIIGSRNCPVVCDNKRVQMTKYYPLELSSNICKHTGHRIQWVLLGAHQFMWNKLGT